jgi:hypothetical protein
MASDLFIVDLFNPLEPELSVQSPVQKIWDLNGHPLLCKFLATDFSRCLNFQSVTLHVYYSQLSELKG